MANLIPCKNPNCNNVFDPGPRNKRKYCSDKCRDRAKRDRKKARRLERAEPIFCQWCKKEIKNPSVRYQKYHMPECSKKAAMASSARSKARRKAEGKVYVPAPGKDKPEVKIPAFYVPVHDGPLFPCPFAAGKVKVYSDGGLTVDGADPCQLEWE